MIRGGKLATLSLVVTLAGGCASTGQTTYRMTTQDGGFVITTGGGRMLPYFTADVDGNLPADRAVADARFGRRRKRVEDWYARRDPDMLGDYRVHQLRDLAMIPVGIVLIPVNFVKSVTRGFIKRKPGIRAEAELLALQAFIADDVQNEDVGGAKTLKVGDLIRMFGGYENDQWLAGQSYWSGTVKAFTGPGHPSPLAIVQLSRRVRCHSTEGDLLILRLRHPGDRWGRVGIVYGYLFQAMPTEQMLQEAGYLSSPDRNEELSGQLVDTHIQYKRNDVEDFVNEYTREYGEITPGHSGVKREKGGR